MPEARPLAEKVAVPPYPPTALCVRVNVAFCVPVMVGQNVWLLGDSAKRKSAAKPLTELNAQI
jgi:hypothetical protein